MNSGVHIMYDQYKSIGGLDCDSDETKSCLSCATRLTVMYVLYTLIYRVLEIKIKYDQP